MHANKTFPERGISNHAPLQISNNVYRRARTDVGACTMYHFYLPGVATICDSERTPDKYYSN